MARTKYSLLALDGGGIRGVIPAHALQVIEERMGRPTCELFDIVAGTFHKQLAETVAHMFRLDEDLSRFYELVSNDGELSWCALGAGRMLRAPTVFEDVVKTNRTLIRTFEPPKFSISRRSSD